MTTTTTADEVMALIGQATDCGAYSRADAFVAQRELESIFDRLVAERDAALAERDELRAAVDGERCRRCGGPFHPDRLMRFCGRCNRWRSMPIVRAALARTDTEEER